MSTTTDEACSGGLNRRTLVRGAVWTVPVVAVAAAAPAFAASCTQFYSGTLDWGNSARYTPAAAGGSGTFLLDDGSTSSLTLTTAFTNYAAASTNPTPAVVPNFGVSSGNVGATGAKGLVLCQTVNSQASLNNAANNQTITFAFGRPMYNLSFILTDLDSTDGQFWDSLAITGAGFTYLPKPTGSTVIGAGLATNVTNTAGNQNLGPFRPTDPDTAFDNVTGTGGNIKITMAGPVTSFKLVYWNRETALGANGSKQTVYVSTLTGSAHNAACP